MSLNILVTGGAGFIGSNLIDSFISQNYDVSVLDNLSSGSINNINTKAVFHKISIEEKDKIFKLFSEDKFEIVFHLAAVPAISSSREKALKEFQTTITGIINLLKAASKIKLKKFIYFSSAAVYSQNAKLPIIENSQTDPISYYGLSKFVGECLVLQLCKINKIPYIIFRPANVYGPRQRTDGEGGAITSFIGQLSSNQNIKINGNGKKTRDFIFVDDVINACMLAIKSNLSGVFNLGTSKETSIIDLAKHLQEITNKAVPIKFLNDKEGEIQNSSLDSQKIKGFGWVPKTDLENGLKITWKYFSAL